MNYILCLVDYGEKERKYKELLRRREDEKVFSVRKWEGLGRLCTGD